MLKKIGNRLWMACMFFWTWIGLPFYAVYAWFVPLWFHRPWSYMIALWFDFFFVMNVKVWWKAHGYKRIY